MKKSKLEAEKIYYAIFKKKIPDFVEKQYQTIVYRIEKNHSNDIINECSKYLENVKDLEALEIAARYMGKIPLLCEKFRAMIYISETIPENYNCFFNEKNSLFKGYIVMVFATLHTIRKVIKGLFLLRIKKP